MLKNKFAYKRVSLSASEEPRSLLRGSSKEKAIMGAVAPKPVLSTHPHSKLLGFLAFSHDSSFSTVSVKYLAIFKLGCFLMDRLQYKIGAILPNEVLSIRAILF